MKAGPLKCPQCQAQVWGCPPDFDAFPGSKEAGAWGTMDAECSNKHQLRVKVFATKRAEVELKKAVAP